MRSLPANADKTPKNRGEDLFQYMRTRGLTEYGSIILVSDVQSVLGIVIPEMGPKHIFDELALIELGAVDYVKNLLLGEGKAFIRHKDAYRILLPSENADFIKRYMNAADRKIKRALKLSRNSPVTDAKPHDLTVQLMMKQESIRRQRDNNQNLS